MPVARGTDWLSKFGRFFSISFSAKVENRQRRWVYFRRAFRAKYGLPKLSRDFDSDISHLTSSLNKSQQHSDKSLKNSV